MGMIRGFIVLAALVGSSAFASSKNGLLITKIRVEVDGRAVIYFNSTISGYACAGWANDSMAIPLNTDGGKSALSQLMAAKLAGRTVDVVGLGTCTLYGGNVEGLEYFTIH